MSFKKYLIIIMSFNVPIYLHAAFTAQATSDTALIGGTTPTVTIQLTSDISFGPTITVIMNSNGTPLLFNPSTAAWSPVANAANPTTITWLNQAFTAFVARTFSGSFNLGPTASPVARRLLFNITPNSPSFLIVPDASYYTATTIENTLLAFDGSFGAVVTPSSITSSPDGTAIINGSTIEYTPNTGFTGTTSFTYIAAVDGGSPVTVTISVTVTAAPPTPPTAKSLSNEFLQAFYIKYNR